MLIKTTTIAAGPDGVVPIGTIREVGNDEAKALIEQRLAVPVIAEPAETAEAPAGETAAVTHVGGGMYELPDGRRFKGKAAALAALDE